MKLTPPPDLTDALQARFARVAARLEDVPALVPTDVAATAGRVLTISDFVLRVLERHPDALLARLADRAPLAPATLAPRLPPPDLAEAAAMTELRRLRQIELARNRVARSRGALLCRREAFPQAQKTDRMPSAES